MLPYDNQLVTGSKNEKNNKLKEARKALSRWGEGQSYAGDNALWLLTTKFLQ